MQIREREMKDEEKEEEEMSSDTRMSSEDKSRWDLGRKIVK